MKTLHEALFSRKNLSNFDNTIVIDDNLEVQYIDNKKVFIFSIYNNGDKNDKISCVVTSSKINDIIRVFRRNSDGTALFNGIESSSNIEIETYKNNLPDLYVDDGDFSDLFLFETKSSIESLIEFLEKHNI